MKTLNVDTECSAHLEGPRVHEDYQSLAFMAMEVPQIKSFLLAG